MRLDRAVDRFLDFRQLERDSPESSLASYRWVLDKLIDRHPEATLSDFEGRTGTERLRDFLRPWAHLAASTRKNRIAILHSFFRWLEAEDLIEVDPSRKIKTPPTRKANVYRPTPAELALIRREATTEERPAILLLEGVGLRNREVREMLWRHLDLTQGTVIVRRKGGDWRELPIDEDVLDGLRACYRDLEPEPDDHVFVAKVYRFDRPGHHQRVRKDPKQSASSQALQRLVHRVSKRAIGRQLYPHQLRHGFSKRYLAEDGQLRELQGLLSHASIQTTEIYVDEIAVEQMRKGLRRAHKRRHSGQHNPEHVARGRETADAPGGIRTPGDGPSARSVSGAEPDSPDDDLEPPKGGAQSGH